MTTATLDDAEVVTDLTAALVRRQRSEQPAVVAHLSLRGTHSCIGVRDAAGQVTPLIQFWPLPLRGADLVAEIAAIDENSPRLVTNFTQACPQEAARITQFGKGDEDLETPAIGWLMLACSLVLGSNEADLAVARQVSDVVEIDTVVIDEGGRYYLDGRRLLRSVMSYRIAGVSAPVLHRSVLESLGGFVADALRRVLQDHPTRAVVCAGDLLDSPFLRSRLSSAMADSGIPVILPPVPI